MVVGYRAGVHWTRRRGEPWGMHMISLKTGLRLSCLRTIDGFIRASNGNWRPSSVGGGDNFVYVENLATKLVTRTDPLMVSPIVALRRGKNDAYTWTLRTLENLECFSVQASPIPTMRWSPPASARPCTHFQKLSLVETMRRSSNQLRQ